MFKTLKQHLIFIPLMLVLVELVRIGIVHFYPETALFDKGSELETFTFKVWQITWITAATLLLTRVVMPEAFRALIRFIKDFNKYSEEYQRTFAVKLWLTIFCALVYLIGNAQTRSRLVDTLTKQLQVRELTGNNDGVEVERYLSFVGQKKGAPWCAAFVSWNFNAVGLKSPPNPKTAWSPAFGDEKYQVWSQRIAKCSKRSKYKVRPGDVFTLYFANLNRIGHTGFITGDSGNYWVTIEGNTAPHGSRDGDGVYSLKRSKSKIYAITNFIDPRS